MAQPMNHNVVQMPGMGERPIVADLRDRLNTVGDYAAVPKFEDALNMFDAQVQITAGFVKNPVNTPDIAGIDYIDPETAVDTLIDVGSPVVNEMVNLKLPAVLKAKGINNPTQDEIDETRAQIIAKTRAGLIGAVTPEAKEPEADAEDSHRVREFLTDKVGSAAKRFSITAKKTRAAYKHYSLLSRDVDNHPVGSDERKNAIRSKKEARNAFVGRLAKTTGIVTVAAFTAESLRTKGIEVGSWFDDKGDMLEAGAVGITLPVFAIGHRLGERSKNTSLRAQMAAMNTVGRVTNAVFSGYREKRSFDMNVVKEKDEAAHDKLLGLEEQIIFSGEHLRDLQKAPGFDPLDPFYQSEVEKHKDLRQERRELEAQLLQEFGKNKLTRKGRIALLVGGVAIGVGVGYYLNKNGLPFIGGKSGSVDQATTTTTTPNGNSSTTVSSTAQHSVPAAPSGGGTGTSSTTTTTIHSSVPTPTGSSSTSTSTTTSTMPTTTTTAAPTTTLPSGGGNGGNTAGNLPPLPKGVNQDAYNHLTPEQQAQFHANYGKLSGDQQKAFNHFVDGIQEIKAQKPQLPEEQRNEMLNNFFKGSQAIHDANPHATPDQISTISENTVRLAEQRANFVGPSLPFMNPVARGAQFDEQFRLYNEAAQHQAQVDVINLASDRAQFVDTAFGPLKKLKESEFDDAFKKYVEAFQNAS